MKIVKLNEKACRISLTHIQVPNNSSSAKLSDWNPATGLISDSYKTWLMGITMHL